MESIKIRHGESLTLPLSTGDPSAVSAEIFVGRPGEMYTLAKSIAITDGNGVFNFSPAETSIPLGSYSYQINVVDSNGSVEKYPSPSGCSDGDCEFPKFVVCEALDEIEVS